MKRIKLTSSDLLIFLCVCGSLFLMSCSQPILESQQCIESRDSVKRFYSYHIGNDMKPTAENLKKREVYLSQNLQTQLAQQTGSAKDYFTQTADYPKAFRAGKCEDTGKDKTNFGILLFWRTNDINIQREIKVETIKENNNWLVNKVTPKN